MYSKVVVGLDGSEGAARGLEHAKELAGQSGGEIIAVHIDERIVAKGDMPTADPAEAEVKEKVRGQVDALNDAGIKTELVESVIVLGGPGRAIADIADGAGADLIVVGTRGHSSIPGVILGSVAHRLLHIAGRPVLAVPPTS